MKSNNTWTRPTYN